MGNLTRIDGNKCPICGHADIGISTYPDTKGVNYYECPNCGGYVAPNDWYNATVSKGLNLDGFDMENLQTYIFYHMHDGRTPFLVSKEIYNKLNKTMFEHFYNLTPEMVEAWYPKTFTEKVDAILLKLKEMSKFDGDSVCVNVEEALYLFFTKSELGDSEKIGNIDQIIYCIEAMLGMNYIYTNGFDQTDLIMNANASFNVQLTPTGLSRIYELQKNHSNSKNVFVAMTFHKSAKCIRDAIEKGIEAADYSSILMDEIVHNHQIVPEMLRLIKESAFMIMDITQPNFGAYFEAGYAQGLGKEVIITCSQEVWNKTDFSCDKDNNCLYKQIATKPHFDIAQKQVLIWENYSDLSKKLSEWIKNIM